MTENETFVDASMEDDTAPTSVTGYQYHVSYYHTGFFSGSRSKSSNEGEKQTKQTKTNPSKEKNRKMTDSTSITPIIPLNKPSLFPECIDAIQDAFRNGKASGNGANTRKVTNVLSSPRFFGHGRVLLTPSCTAALEMAALILDLQPGDEVIVPSYTFVSTANAFALRGVRLVFADCCDAESGTPNVDVQDILRRITPRTKTIVVVHYAGVPIDLAPLLRLNIPIVEDCAHAIGSYYVRDNHSSTSHGMEHAGTIGCLSTFSFHDTKNVGIGEGGCLVVNDPQLWEKARECRNCGTNRSAFLEGRVSYYTWTSLGSSYLMSDVDAGMLWGCLQHFDDIQLKRLQIWDFYHERIWASSIVWRKPWREHGHNGHIYYLQFFDVNVRQEFEQFMEQCGICVSTHYKPLGSSPFISHQHMIRNGGGESSISATPSSSTTSPCKNAQIWSDATVRLPMFFELTLEQQVRVVNTVNSFLIHKAGTDKNGHSWSLRPASTEHWEAIRKLRNENRLSFLTKGVIDVTTHKSFMKKHSRTYRVAVDNSNGCVIGFCGHVRNDERLATHRSYRRKGVGVFMKTSFMRENPSITCKVLRSNKEALMFYISMGFVPCPDDWASGSEVVRLFSLRSRRCYNEDVLASKL